MLSQIIYLCADCLSHNLFRRMCSKLYQHELYLVTSLFNDFMKPFPLKSNLTEPKSYATTLNRKKELKMAKLSGVRQCQHPKPDENTRNWWNRLKSDATVQNLTEASESGRNCPKLKIWWKGPKLKGRVRNLKRPIELRRTLYESVRSRSNVSEFNLTSVRNRTETLEIKRRSIGRPLYKTFRS